MAYKKKVRSKRKSKAASTQQRLQPEAQILPKEKPGIVEKVKSMFNSQQESSSPQRQLPPQTVEGNPIGTSSKTNSGFEETASRLESEYGGGDPDVTTEPVPEGPQIVSPQTMRKILAGIFNGMAKAHGEHWRVSEADLDMIEPFNTAAVTELVSKWSWLRESEYKATIAWAGVMGLFIASRSQAGAKFLETMMEKFAGLFSRKDSNTKPDSPASPDSSHHPDTAKPS